MAMSPSRPPTARLGSRDEGTHKDENYRAPRQPRPVALSGQSSDPGILGKRQHATNGSHAEQEDGNGAPGPVSIHRANGPPGHENQDRQTPQHEREKDWERPLSCIRVTHLDHDLRRIVTL